MERFDYTPPTTLTVPPVEGLVIREIEQSNLDLIREMNRTIFKEERIINTFERDNILILLATINDEPVGFKIGYRENRFTFYSAKGGVMPAFRRKGIAIALLDEMIRIVREAGYRRFAFDTFPNLHPGMTILALAQGFRLIKSDYNSVYREYRLRFETKLTDVPGD